MKPALLITAAVAVLSTPGLAQTITTPIAVKSSLSTAASKALGDREADAAAASDIARVRPLPETVSLTDVPPSQITPVAPASFAAPTENGGQPAT